MFTRKSLILATVAVIGLTGTGGGIPSPVSMAQAMTPAELVERAYAIEPLRGMIQAIDTHFPGAAQTLRPPSLEAMKGATLDDLTAIIGGNLLRFRTQQLPALRHAPDSALRALLDDQISIMHGLRAADPVLCAGVLALGPVAVPFGHPILRTRDLTAEADRLFGTIAAGQRAAVLRDEPRDADYPPLLDLLAERGVSLDDIDRLSQAGPTDAWACDVFIPMLTVFRDAAHPGADRLRGQILIDLFDEQQPG